MSKNRTWKMFAHEKNGTILNASVREFTAQMYAGSSPLIKVNVIESDEGTHLGWIKTGTDTPIFIYHEKVFPICFTYGVEAAVKAGDGVVIRLKIEKEVK
jgi:hypothetical protein